MSNGLDSWKVWEIFFNDDFRRQKFEPSCLYVGPSFSLDNNSSRIDHYFDGRVLENRDHFLYCFDLHLKELGYSPDLVGSRNGLVHEGRDFPGWVRYTNKDASNRVLAVNFEGMKILYENNEEGPWADILIADLPLEKLHFRNSIGDSIERMAVV